jgi:hypothetical protein
MTRFRSMEPRDIIANVLHWTEHCYEHGTPDEELQAGYHHYLSETGIGDGFAGDIGDVQNKQFAEEIGRLDEAFHRYTEWATERRRLRNLEGEKGTFVPDQWHASDDEAVELLEEFAFLAGADDGQPEGEG